MPASRTGSNSSPTRARPGRRPARRGLSASGAPRAAGASRPATPARCVRRPPARRAPDLVRPQQPAHPADVQRHDADAVRGQSCSSRAIRSRSSVTAAAARQCASCSTRRACSDSSARRVRLAIVRPASQPPVPSRQAYAMSPTRAPFQHDAEREQREGHRQRHDRTAGVVAGGHDDGERGDEPREARVRVDAERAGHHGERGQHDDQRGQRRDPVPGRRDRADQADGRQQHRGRTRHEPGPHLGLGADGEHRGRDQVHGSRRPPMHDRQGTAIRHRASQPTRADLNARTASSS